MESLKTKKLKKIVASCLAAVSIATVGITAIATDGFKTFGKNEHVQIEQSEENNGNNGNETTDTDNVLVADNDGIKLYMSKAITVVSTTANAAYISQTVTATITPTTVVDQYVTWSLSWKTGVDLSSKSVSDYVQLTDDSQGSLTATINAYKSFRGSDIILTCTTRQDKRSATCTIKYDGIPSSLSIGKPSGTGSYNLGAESVDLLYVGTSYTSTISMDNIFHDVGKSYDNFSVTVSGVGTVQCGTYKHSPRAASWDDVSTVNLSDIAAELVTCSISGNTLTIKPLKSIHGYYESYETYQEEMNGTVHKYTNKVRSLDVDSEGNEPYLLITVKHKTLDFSASYKVFIGESVDSLTLGKTEIVF